MKNVWLIASIGTLLLSAYRFVRGDVAYSAMDLAFSALFHSFYANEKGAK